MHGIYVDRLLRSSVVVEDQDGTLYLVPRSQGGWHRRVRLTLTPEKRADRLTPARRIDPGWLGIPLPPPIGVL